MLVIFLKVLEHLKENGISHLKAFLLCFFEQIIVLILKFFVLEPAPIELYLFLVAQMSSSFFFGLLLNSLGSIHGLITNLVVLFSLFINLLCIISTRPISFIYSWSIKDTLRLACPVFRSFTSFSFPCPY